MVISRHFGIHFAIQNMLQGNIQGEVSVKRLLSKMRMIISEILKVENIKISLDSGKKLEAIKEMVDLLSQNGAVGNVVDFLNSIYLREELQSTAIFPHVAIPHARTPSAKKIILAIGISREGIEFESEDGELTNVIFLIATNGESHSKYLKLLSQITSVIKTNDVVGSLLNANSELEVCQIIEDAETKVLCKT